MGLVGWIIIAAVVLLLLYAVGIYNKLVRLRALVREGFSGITVQLRRRADLIPNLVESVKGYATHERETLDQVIAHRGDAVNARGVEATAAADNAMTAMIGRLFAVAEAYPDLKANQNMMQLSEELTSTENKVSFARQAYNDAVMTYNNAREVFPSSVVAGMFSFQPAQLLEISTPAAREAPKVSFG